MDALIRRLRAPRSLGSVVLRLLVPRIVLFTSAAGVLLVGQVMAVNPSSAPLTGLSTGLSTAVPTWSAEDRSAEPDCVPAAQWPPNQLGSAVVVHRFLDDATVRVSFLSAWTANHDASRANDLWVLGVCP